MTTLAPPDHETSRLADYDRARMVRAVGHTLALWRRGYTRGAAAFHGFVAAMADSDPTAWETLRRNAMGAIGCDERDLRRAELDEVAQLVADVAARPELWRFPS